MNKEAEHTKPLKTAFYIRVSTEEQSEMYGIDVQKTMLDKLVEARSITDNIETPKPEHIYIDSISGTTPLTDRPAFNRLLEDIKNSPPENKPFDIIYVYKLDRFARRLKILLDVVEVLDEYSIKFYSASESIDTSTPFGKAVLGIMGVIAELEIETIKQRTHAGREEAVKRGVFMAGKKYGYTKNSEKKLVINKTESKVIQGIFYKYVFENYTTYQLQNYLSKNNIPNPTNSKKSKARTNTKHGIYYWSVSTINRILQDDIYIGLYYYNKTYKGKTLPKNKWNLSEVRSPRIIDDITFIKAQDRMARSRTFKKTNDNESQYLLRSLLKCDSCFNVHSDKEMVTWHGDRKKLRNGNVSYYYKCRRKNKSKGTMKCNTIPLPAKQLEEYVTNFIVKLLSNPKAVLDYQNNLKSTKVEKGQLQTEIEKCVTFLNSVPTIRQNYIDQHTINVIDTESLETKLDNLEKKKQDFEKSLNEATHQFNTVSLSNNYQVAFSSFKKKYGKVLKNIESNPAKKETLFEILHLLIEEIVVYSRPVNSKDRLSGQKKENQSLPYKLHIKLKLPQEILLNLSENISRVIDKEGLGIAKKLGYMEKQFRAENLEWWVGRGSNSRHPG